MEKIKQPRKNGFQKGVSGNPDGRPVGTKNAIPNELKIKVQNYLNDGFDNFVEDLKNIEDAGFRCKVYLEMCKAFLPKPKEEEVVNEEQKFRSELMNKLFPNRDSN